MIKIDLNTYSDLEVKEKYTLDELKNKLDSAYMNGWMNPSINIERINTAANIIKENFDTLVIVGIGGSFLGSKAMIEALNPYYKDNEIEIIYTGYSMEKEKERELIKYLDNKNFIVNVISKSGNTRETTNAYNSLKELIISKYGKQALSQRVIITTDKEKGQLLEEAKLNNNLTFEIPDNIGGRYSLATPAHLLPMAVAGIDINTFMNGYNNGINYLTDAFNLATKRYNYYENNKYIENYVIYQEKLLTLSEWIKQLFGETEGKENKGIFPVSTFYTRDLHSLGQFIQEGSNIIFETVIKNNNCSGIEQKVLKAVATAHKINTPSNIIEIDELNPYTLGELTYFFMLTSSMSGFLFDIDPFNQPGVEAYKKEISKEIN